MSFPRISCSVCSAVLPSLGPCEVHTSLVTHGGDTRPDFSCNRVVPAALGSRHKWWLALALAPWSREGDPRGGEHDHQS